LTGVSVKEGKTSSKALVGGGEGTGLGGTRRFPNVRGQTKGGGTWIFAKEKRTLGGYPQRGQGLRAIRKGEGKKDPKEKKTKKGKGHQAHSWGKGEGGSTGPLAEKI